MNSEVSRSPKKKPRLSKRRGVVRSKERELDDPDSNTGFNSHRSPKGASFTVGIDTLTLNLERVASESGVMGIIDLVNDFFNEAIQFSPDRPAYSPIKYDGSTIASARGTYVLWRKPREAFGWGNVRLHLPGKALSQRSTLEIVGFIQIMVEQYGAKGSRIDICVDDHNRVASMEDWQSAAAAGNYSGVRSSREFKSRSLSTTEVGHTVYFGSPASNKQLRVYDKTVESQGRIDAIRIEVQFRKAAAEAAVQCILAASEGEGSGCGSQLSRLVTGAVVFPDNATGDKNVNRRSLLPWYRKLVRRLGKGFRLKLAKREVLLEKTEAWINHSVVGSLAMLEKYHGPQTFWNALFQEVEAKKPLLNKTQMAVVSQAIRDRVRAVESTEELPHPELDRVEYNQISISDFW